MLNSMRALSIRQPWAWAIQHAGKAVENREWATCHYRGPVLLHVSRGCTRDEYDSAVSSIELMRKDVGCKAVQVPPLRDLPRGCLVGIARLVNVHEHPTHGVVAVEGVDGIVRELDWERGYVGYRIAGALGLQLADVRLLPAVPFKGALGFFFAYLQGLPHADVYEAAWREMEGS
jgi:hypothetical protein